MKVAEVGLRIDNFLIIEKMIAVTVGLGQVQEPAQKQQD